VEKTPVDSRIMAAAHAAHFERWRRLYSKSPVYAPRGFEQMLPESARSVPTLLEAARDDQKRKRPNGEQRIVAGTVAALARAEDHDDVMRALQGQGKAWAPEHKKKNGAKLAQVKIRDPFQLERTLGLRVAPDPSEPERGDSGCRCADAYGLCRGGHHGAVAFHRSNLDFDADTFISKAWEYVVLKASQNDAQKVIESARPPMWAKFDDDAEDFFKETFVINEAAPDKDLEPAKLGPAFLMREKAGWQLNRDFTGFTDLVLSFTKYEEDLDEYERSIGLRFDYKLRECKETQFFVARSKGGINVDDGETRILWESPEGAESDGLLYIFAEKRLRFVATSEISTEQALLLNMTAPATLSMLMQRLALDGPLELVTKNNAARDIENPETQTIPPAPSHERPTARALVGDETHEFEELVAEGYEG